jgi:hypothetical protein
MLKDKWRQKTMWEIRCKLKQTNPTKKNGANGSKISSKSSQVFATLRNPGVLSLCRCETVTLSPCHIKFAVCAGGGPESSAQWSCGAQWDSWRDMGCKPGSRQRNWWLFSDSRDSSDSVSNPWTRRRQTCPDRTARCHDAKDPLTMQKSTSKTGSKIVLSIQPVAPNTQVIVAKFTLRELEPRARCMFLSWVAILGSLRNHQRSHTHNSALSNKHRPGREMGRWAAEVADSESQARKCNKKMPALHGVWSL